MTTDHFVDPTLFVPPSTQENYTAGARLSAKLNGTTVAEEWSRVIADFEANHDRDGAAGWNHLAAWAKTVDPEDIVEVDPEEVRKARELATAIQDPDAPASLDLTDPTVKEAVVHAHETNAARQESTPGSPAGTDPVRSETETGHSPVAAGVKSGETDEGGEKREAANPKTRTATPPRKTTR